MSAGASDMSTPVTRGELHEELARFEARIEQRLERFEHGLERRLEHRFEQLEQKLDQKLEQKLEQKLDQKLNAALEIWGGALLARIAESEQRLLAELARHTRAVYESMTGQISGIDEKYVDLPPRVSRLEAEVFAPKPR